MPFGSYEVSEEMALSNAFRFIKEGFADAVKIEGGRDRANTVKKIVKGGIAVMGHVGLTPQAISVLGGFRAQGRYVFVSLFQIFPFQRPHLSPTRTEDTPFYRNKKILVCVCVHSRMSNHLPFL